MKSCTLSVNYRVGIDMSPEEELFLHRMDYIVELREFWIKTGRYKGGTAMPCERICAYIQQNANSVGWPIGYASRWSVTGSSDSQTGERSINIEPLNDSAIVCMQLYKELYTERELSSGY